jgi:chorismate synthase
MLTRIETLRRAGDSAGGVVSCRITGVPAGIGEPVFDKLDARLAAAMLSLGAAKGFELGSGFASAAAQGSLLNDAPATAPPKPIGVHPQADALLIQGKTPPYKTNNAGGVLGGIATGMPIEFRVAFKPVPSISLEQKTINREGAARPLAIKGRHDVCIVPRAVPVVEAMAALVLTDMILLARGNV